MTSSNGARSFGDIVGIIVVTAVAILVVMLVYGFGNSYGWWSPGSGGNAYAKGSTGYANPNDARRAQAWSNCEAEAAIRRDMGFNSQARWINATTCVAEGGVIESGRLR